MYLIKPFLNFFHHCWKRLYIDSHPYPLQCMFLTHSLETFLSARPFHIEGLSRMKSLLCDYRGKKFRPHFGKENYLWSDREPGIRLTEALRRKSPPCWKLLLASEYEIRLKFRRTAQITVDAIQQQWSRQNCRLRRIYQTRVSTPVALLLPRSSKNGCGISHQYPQITQTGEI